jgi:hypothetical protein
VLPEEEKSMLKAIRSELAGTERAETALELDFG